MPSRDPYDLADDDPRIAAAEDARDYGHLDMPDSYDGTGHIGRR